MVFGIDQVISFAVENSFKAMEIIKDKTGYDVEKRFLEWAGKKEREEHEHPFLTIGKCILRRANGGSITKG